MKDAPLIRSYSAVFSKERQQYHILIDDVTETHIEAAERKPTIEYGRALAQGLATIHAHWWGAKRIKSAGDSIPTASQINRFVAIAEPGVDPILEAFSASLKPHWPDLIRDFYANHPQAMINRTENENGFTLIHGDVNHRNLLVPKNGHQPLYIIDRQPFDWSLTTWLGVYDLAYALVLYWKPDLRRRYERQLLEIYHDQLILCGVRDYDWNQLFEDYRLSAAMGIYVATEWCRGGINERWIQVWLTMLQRSLEAVDDLNCELTWKGYAR